MLCSHCCWQVLSFWWLHEPSYEFHEPSLYSHTNENSYTLPGFSLLGFNPVISVQLMRESLLSFPKDTVRESCFPCILQKTHGFCYTGFCFAGSWFAGCGEATLSTGLTSGALSSHSCIRYVSGCDQFIDLKWSSEWIIAFELKASVNGFLKSRKDNLQKLL